MASSALPSAESLKPSGPTARPIPAWGAAPGERAVDSRAESPIHRTTPAPMARAFSPCSINSPTLGLRPRLGWRRAFGAQTTPIESLIAGFDDPL